MSGTPEGGKKAATTNKKRYGNNFYKIQGAKGGKLGKTGGFAYVNSAGVPVGRLKASEAGRKGGKISKRRPAVEDDWGFLKVQDDEPILESVELQRSWKDRIWRHRV